MKSKFINFTRVYSKSEDVWLVNTIVMYYQHNKNLLTYIYYTAFSNFSSFLVVFGDTRLVSQSTASLMSSAQKKIQSISYQYNTGLPGLLRTYK